MGRPVEEVLASEMDAWEASGLRRHLADEDVVRLRDFAGNDYLGMARDEGVVEAARAALIAYGIGGRASRLLGGGTPAHAEAERAAAAWLRAEAALLFPSGYQANLGLVTSLAQRGDVVVSDRLNHASLVDAARLSRARVLIHEHVDLDDVARCLERGAAARRRVVLTEGIFSMDGDAAPLADLHALCVRHDAWLVVDEAHAAGVVGSEGAGAWAAWGGEHDERLAARVVTGGKALGVTGAFAIGSQSLREHLVNRARSFVYTTAASPAVAGALVEAISRCRAADDARQHALASARLLATRLDVPTPAGAIVPVRLGSPGATVDGAAALRRQGFDVRAVRPPTVPEGTSRLRIVCHAHNDEHDVVALAEALEALPVASRRQATRPGRARPLFVVGTDTDVGKTVVSALLLGAAAEVGPAAYWKPVQTGSDADASTVRRLAGAGQVLEPTLEFAHPASPHEAANAEGAKIRPETIERALEGYRDSLEDTRLVVELAGGLLVPYRADDVVYTQADLLMAAQPDNVLVARSSVGTLNHTLLTLEAMRSRGLEPRALFLVGEEHAENAATLRRLAGVRAVYEVPRFETLDAAALETWRRSHDLEAVFGP